MPTQYINVIPLTKTARTVQPYYTYSVSGDKIADTGNLVRIPFGSQIIRGVVIGQNKKSKFNYAVKPINKILSKNKYIRKNQITLAHTIAKRYAISISTVVKLMLPKRLTLKHIQKSQSIKYLKKARTQKTPIVHIGLNDDDVILLIVKERERSKHTGQLLVLFPTAEKLLYVYTYLRKKIKEKITLIHSRLTGVVFTKNYLSIANGSAGIILALRHGPLLPFHTLNGIITVDRNHTGHKQWDHRPHFDTRDLIPLIQKIYNPVKTIFCVSIPDAETMLHIKDKTFRIGIKKNIHFSKISIVNMSHTFTPIHDDIIERLQRSMRRQSIIVHNRKGLYRRVHCKDCDWIARCKECSLTLIEYEKQMICNRCDKKTSIPPFCPNCESPHLRSILPAIQFTEKYVRSQIPSSEKEIEISTNAILSKPVLPEYDTIVIVDSGVELDYPSWNGKDTFIEKVANFLLRLTPNGVLYLQTKQPEKLKSLFTKKGIEKFYKMELELRKKHHYPPFTDLVLLSRTVPKNKTIDTRTTTDILSKTGIHYYSYTHPSVTRKNYHTYSFLLKTHVGSTQWESFIKMIPKGWNVNISPHTI